MTPSAAATGPLRVTNPEPRDPLYAALIKAAGEVGIAHNPDYNGAQQDGIAMSQATIAAGRRMSTAALLSGSDPQPPKPAHRDRRADRGALLEGKRCIGVRYSVGGAVREARAAREVVVSAGIDQLAAIARAVGHRPAGAPARASGIEVRHALPGVGENLRDHYAPRTRWAIGAKGITFNDRGRGLGLVRQALRYVLTGRACSAWSAAPIRAFVRSREGLEAPDLLLGWVPMLTEPGPKGPQAVPPVRHDLLRAPDAAGEQGAHPHHRGRSAPAAGDQLQLPRRRRSMRELTVRAIRIARADHDRAARWPSCR